MLTGTSTAVAITSAILSFTFVVEDGSGKPDAVSYVDVSEADAIMKSHPLWSTWNALTTAQKQAALKNGSAYEDRRYRFYSKPLTATQALQFPRYKTVDSKGRVLPAGVIPYEIKVAATLLGLEWAQGNLWASVADEGVIKSFTVGALSITYDTKQGLNGVYGKSFPDIDLLLNSFADRKTADYVDQPMFDGV